MAEWFMSQDANIPGVTYVGVAFASPGDSHLVAIDDARFLNIGHLGDVVFNLTGDYGPRDLVVDLDVDDANQHGIALYGPTANAIASSGLAGILLAGISTYRVLLGSSLGDTSSGTALGDLFLGLAGDDTFRARAAANDLIDGGSGTDSVTYASLASGIALSIGRVDGTLLQQGAVVLKGFNSKDYLYGIEKVTLTSLNDSVTIRATASGGFGQNVTLLDGGGYDILRFDVTLGGMPIFGNWGTDGAYGARYADGSTVFFNPGDFEKIELISDTAAPVDTVIRGATLVGTSSANYMRPGFNPYYYNGPNYSFDGNGGDDYLYGGPGHDLLSASSGRVFLYGDAGNDVLKFVAGSASINGAVMAGGIGHDTYYLDGLADYYVLTEGDRAGDIDRIVFSDSITADEVTFVRGSESYFSYGHSVSQSFEPIGGSFRYYSTPIYGQTVSTPRDLVMLVHDRQTNKEYKVVLVDQFHTLTPRNSIFEYVQFADGEVISLVDKEFTTYGTAGNDTIVGITKGGSNRDTIYGYGGNDDLNGYEGNDLLYGGAGNDRLDGSVGNDLIRGDDGDDTIIASEGSDIVSGGAGFDSVYLGYYYSSLSFFLTKVDTNLVISLTDGRKITLEDQFVPGRGVELLKWSASASLDLTQLSSNHAPTTVADSFTLNGVKTIAGNVKGNDSDSDGDTTNVIPGNVTSEQGGTVVINNSGDFTYTPPVNFFGLDRFTYTLVDRLNVGSIGTAVVAVNQGIYGTTGPDTLVGIAGRASYVYGLEGDDVLNGNDGDDFLNGGKGSDTIGKTAARSSGYDTVVYDTASTGFIAYRDDAQYIKVVDTSTNGWTGATYDAIYNGVEKIQFSNTSIDLATTLLAIGSTWGSYTKSGTTGDDTILGFYVPNVLRGGNGNDSITGGASNDTLSGDGGNDGVFGRDGNDTLNGGVGDDTLFGGKGNDVLNGDDGNDTLVGEEGDDVLVGGKGADVFGSKSGDAGSDKVVYAAASSAFIIFRDNADYVKVVDTSSTTTGWTGTTFDRVYNGIETIQFNDKSLDLTTQLLAVGSGWGIVTKQGTAGADSLTAYTYASTVLNGLAGNDRLDGGRANDTLNGGDGDDRLNGYDGDDLLSGGKGSDAIGSVATANAGIDTAVYETSSSGFVVIRDNADYVKVFDTTGNNWTGTTYDKIYNGVEKIRFTNTTLDLTTMLLTIGSGWGSANRIGTNGNDTLSAVDYAPSTLLGNGGDDVLYGASGFDGLDGGSGNDKLYGYAGNDELYGSDGDDALNGGDGDDIMNGGRGADSIGSNASMNAGFDFARYDSTNAGFIVYRDNASYVKVVDTNTPTATGHTGATYDRIYNGVEQIRFSNFTIDLTTTLLTVGSSWGTTIKRGTSGADVIRGYADAANRLSGDNGNDTLYGARFNDFLNGGDGDDALYGYDGDDTLNGGKGADTIGGRTGSDGGIDTAAYDSSDNGFIIFRDDPNFVKVIDTNGTGWTGKTFDSVYNGVEKIQFANRTINLTTDLLTIGSSYGFARDVYGTAGADSIRGYAYAPNVLHGEDGDDTLTGGSKNDKLEGSGGNDKLMGGDGNDSLVGGDGNDKLSGGAGNDRLIGGTGADIFIFDTPLDGLMNVDTLVDFDVASDTVRLDHEFFSGLSTTLSRLSEASFAFDSATGMAPQIVYDTASRALFYDSNGADAGGMTKFAVVEGGPALTASRFSIV